MTSFDDRMRAYARDLDAAVADLDTEAALARIDGPRLQPLRPRLALAAGALAAVVLAVLLPRLLDDPRPEIAPIAPELPVHPWSQGDWPPAGVPSVDGWVRVPAELVGDPAEVTLDVTSWRGGFVRLLGGGQLRASRDGILWTDLAPPPVDPWVSLQLAIGDDEGRLVVVTAAPEGVGAWRTGDGASWEALTISAGPEPRMPYRAVRSDAHGIVVSYVVEGRQGEGGLWRLEGDRLVDLDTPSGFRGRVGSDGLGLVALAGDSGFEPFRSDGGAWEPLPPLPVEGLPADEAGFPLWIGGLDGQVMVASTERAHLLVLDGDRWVEPEVGGAPPVPGTPHPSYSVLNVVRLDGELHLVGGVLRDPNTTASHDFAVWRRDGDAFVPVVPPDSAIRHRLWAHLETPWPVPTVEGTTLVATGVAQRTTVWVHRTPKRDVALPEPEVGAGPCSAAGEPIGVELPYEGWVPEAVAATREALARAAATCDLEALGALAGPDFVGADGDPVEDVVAHLAELEDRWARGDLDGPGPLLALRRLVELPPADGAHGAYDVAGAAYAWPYLTRVLVPGTAPWAIEEVARTGLYGRETLDGWWSAAGGLDDGTGTPQTTHVPYQGWRVVLDDEGRWIGFVDGRVPLPDGPTDEGGTG